MSITLDATREDARSMARRLATPNGYEDTKGAAMHRAARSLGVGPSFYRRLIDGNLKIIPAHIYLQLKAKLDEAEAKTARKAELAKQSADAAKGRPHEADLEHVNQSISAGIETLEKALERLKFKRD
ncbi:MAG: hypothetical protein P1U50_01000 [Parvibaculaceae bacterium]|nr:hypothetical protein [Parvibaculaceae bacterium]